MRKWIIAIGILVLIGVGYGVYSYTKGPRQLGNEKTDIHIDATELLIAFEQDEIKANTLYLDKIIEVSGTILEISSSDMKNIVLDAGNPMSTVVCELGDESVNNDLKVGDKVIIKGQCTGYLMDVILVKSIIIKK